MPEIVRFAARHAWCEKCMELVGQPRVTVKEARADLRAHRKAGHPPATAGRTIPAKNGQYSVCTDPTYALDNTLREVFYTAYLRAVQVFGWDYWSAHGAGLRAVANSTSGRSSSGGEREHPGDRRKDDSSPDQQKVADPRSEGRPHALVAVEVVAEGVAGPSRREETPLDQRPGESRYRGGRGDDEHHDEQGAIHGRSLERRRRPDSEVG